MKNPKLEATLGKLQAQSAHQPGIYYQYLVNASGHSPSAHEIDDLCEHISNYVKGCRQQEAKGLICTTNHNLANKIDNYRRSKRNPVTKVQTKAGFRKYLNTKPQVNVDQMATPSARCAGERRTLSS
jgi:hypothetical protein